jgi:hypothetical protein
VRYDFDLLRDELLAKGERFTPATLAQLRYPDILRAAIGDAGEAACSQEMAQAERELRLSAYNHLTNAREVRSFRVELDMLGMWLDVVQRIQSRNTEALPRFKDLSPQLKAYLLIRCLRSHADQPQERLQALQLELLDFRTKKNADKDALSTAGVMFRAAHELLTAPQPADILEVRKAFYGFDTLTYGLDQFERAIVLTTNISGYHCTGGCFLLPGIVYE